MRRRELVDYGYADSLAKACACFLFAIAAFFWFLGDFSICGCIVLCRTRVPCSACASAQADSHDKNEKKLRHNDPPVMFHVQFPFDPRSARSSM